MRKRTAMLSLLFSVMSTKAAGLDLSGYIALEERVFFQSEQFAEQEFGAMPSLIVEPEIYHSSDDRKHSWVATLFFHYDPNDDARTHFDIRQADWTFVEGDFEIRAGISKVYWGVAESRHLVDSINQVDAVEDVDEEDRLGQPMLQLALFKDWGSLRFFYLPYFRVRSFPGAQGRLRGAWVVDDDKPAFEESMQEWYPNFALRYEHSFGLWDIGVAQFHGTARAPVFQLKNDHFIPFYQTINQTSVDAQYTEDAWLWKLEAIYRHSENDEFVALTGGFEYTFFGINDSDQDVSVLAEYHYDGRNAASPATLFDNDFFIGTRYVLNNVSDTEFLGGAVIDLGGNGLSVLLEASHRLNDHLKLEFDARLFFEIDRSQPFAFLNRDDFMQLRLSYFF